MAEVNGTYGSNETPCKVFFLESEMGGAWYAVEGSKNINFTLDWIEEGVNVEELTDLNTATSSYEVLSDHDIRCVFPE